MTTVTLGILSGFHPVKLFWRFQKTLKEEGEKKIKVTVARRDLLLAGIVLNLVVFVLAWLVAGGTTIDIPRISLPAELIIFFITLAGIAIFHEYNVPIAGFGLVSTIAFELIFRPGFTLGVLAHHLVDESKIAGNVFGLILGFAALAYNFETSNVIERLSRRLPKGPAKGCALLCGVFVVSMFLDNIAAAVIGGSTATQIFKGVVYPGFYVAITAASNAGGAAMFSGDSTTMMLWAAGAGIFVLLPAFYASLPALGIIGPYYGWRQHKHWLASDASLDTDVTIDSGERPRIRKKNLFVVLLMLVGAIVGNFVVGIPAVGIWAVLLLGAAFCPIPWGEVVKALPGAIFLGCLIFMASLMPINELAITPSLLTSFMLGILSAFLDNIPLTRLAMAQGGYDWAVVAWSVGYGGSMTWFGSSAGVAICGRYKETKNFWVWIRTGAVAILAYFVGSYFIYLCWGWHPTLMHN